MNTSVNQFDEHLCTGYFLVERVAANIRAEFLTSVKHQPGISLALVIGTVGVDVKTLSGFEPQLLPIEKRRL